MRVLYVFRSLAYWGGIERILVDKMNNLVSMYDYEVYMLTTDQGDHPVPYELDARVHLRDLGIRLHQQYQYHGFKRWLVLCKLLQLYKRQLKDRIFKISPDVIICTTSNYWDINIISRVKGSIPLVVESHSIYKQTLIGKGTKGIISDYLYRRGLCQSQMIVTLTERDAEEWRKHFVHVCVIPNFVHLNDQPCATLEEKRVIWVGRFDYQKRPMEMVRIWEKLYSQFPDWHLDMYGEGEHLAELETTVSSIGMNIHIHPPTSQIFDRYRNSSVLVSTSLFEPFGLVIPEAMSCGLPVVAYDCPYGPSYIINDGVSGFLIQMNNRDAFASKLMLLMDNKMLREKMGKASLLSSRLFSSRNIMEKWASLFSINGMNDFSNYQSHDSSSIMSSKHT